MQSENVAQTYKLYLKAKTILAEGVFKCIVNAAFLAQPPGVEVKKDRDEPTHCGGRLFCESCESCESFEFCESCSKLLN